MASKFSNKKWYRQGGLIVPFFECPAMKTIAEILGHDNYLGIYRGEKTHNYFNKVKLKELAEKHIIEQLNDKEHINKLYNVWKKTADKSLKLINNNVSIKVLVPVLEDFWRAAWIIEYYDPYGEEYLDKYVKKTNDEIAVLTSPSFISKMQEEELHLLKLALDKKCDKTELDEHQKNYYFIKTSWADASLYTLEEINDKLKKIRKSGAETIQENINKIEFHFQKTQERKKQIQKTLTKDEERIAYFFERLTEWRDERKPYVQKANYYLQEQLKKLYPNIEIKFLKFLNVYQLEQKLDINLLKECHDLCVDMMNEHGEWVYITGKQAKVIAEEIEKEFSSGELKGMSACQGKVTGIARVIKTSEQFKEFKQGEILVTVVTRPEFVPLMKKASAIVTDEGGITSHAAIVSRELKIPCIIGTQKATSIIKTGDTIEVDAVTGKIVIIK